MRTKLTQKKENKMKTLTVLVILAVALSLAKAKHYKGYCATNLCLGFLLDESGSVGAQNFELMKEFVKNVTSSLHIGKYGSRVGVITYTREPIIDCNFDQYLSNENATAAIDALTYQGGSTWTGAALTKAKELFMSGPPNCTKVLVVITDGQSIDSVSGPATALKNMMVEIFSIGVGSADQSQLLEIASENKTEHTFMLNDHSSLKGSVDTIQGKVCPEHKDKLAKECCEYLKAKGMCIYPYLYKLCGDTCKCANKASDESCELFAEAGICQFPNFAPFCQKTCNHCPWL